MGTSVGTSCLDAQIILIGNVQGFKLLKQVNEEAMDVRSNPLKEMLKSSRGTTDEHESFIKEKHKGGDKILKQPKSCKLESFIIEPCCDMLNYV